MYCSCYHDTGILERAPFAVFSRGCRVSTELCPFCTGPLTVFFVWAFVETKTFLNHVVPVIDLTGD